MSLINAREAAERIGISERTFHKMRALGKFRNCMAPEPMGQRRYVAEQIDRIGHGQSTTRLVHRRRA